MVVMRNFNAMLFQYKPSTHLIYKLTGGIIELKFFLGNKYPEEVVRDYHN